MASVNRFMQAQPAQDNYFNTFVPLPMEQLTALGMSRKQDLEKNQALIDKGYNDLLNIQAIPGSKDETYLKTQAIPAMTDIAMKYANVDLSQPQEVANLRREMRTKIDPNVINRIEQSHAGYLRYNQMVDRLSQEGKYSRQLDTANPQNWDSANQGVFSSSPEAYEGKASLFEPYFAKLHPTEHADYNSGMLVSSITPEHVNSVAQANARDLVNTPKGQQELRLFKANYPDAAKQLGDDTKIMQQLMNDYGSDRVYTDLTPLPYEWMRAMHSATNTTPNIDTSLKAPLRSTNPGKIESFDRLGDVRSKIQDLNQAGNTEASRDLQRKLDAALKKYDLPLNTEGHVEGNKTSAAPLYPDISNLFSHSKTGSDIVATEAKVKKVLDELSTTTSNRSSFGSPWFSSKSLMDEDVATKKKVAPADWADISNHIIANPNDVEVKSINADGKDQKINVSNLPKFMGRLQTKDMIDLSMGILPDAKNNYKPSVTMAYQDPKNGVTKVNMLVNDPEQVRAFATLAAKRGDYETETALNNPVLVPTIERTNFSTPKTFHIKGGQYEKDPTTGEIVPKLIPITIEENNTTGGFTISTPGDKPLDVDSRKQLVAVIYSFMANNRNREVPAGEPSSEFIEK